MTIDPIVLTEKNAIEYFGTDFTKETIFKINKYSQDIDGDFLFNMVDSYKKSKKYKMIQKSFLYYENEHDIERKKRIGIGADGQDVELIGLPNNKIMDNQFKKVVDQKKNYLLGKPITFSVDKNEEHQELLRSIFDDKRFPKKAKKLGLNAILGGIAYLYPYKDVYEQGNPIKAKIFSALQGFSLWSDEDHEESPAFVRFYNNVDIDKKGNETTTEVIEFYTSAGIFKYERGGKENKIRFVGAEPYAYLEETGQAVDVWMGNCPVIAFKSSDIEQPLLKNVKGLQDALNTMLSAFSDNMQEDSRNTVLVVTNYDGADPNSFRHNLNKAGVIFVETNDHIQGDVKTLNIEVNADNYEVVIKLLRKAIVDNARGFDAKDERMSNNPNQMNIQSMYSEIDLDASDMESEFQSSFEKLLKLIYDMEDVDYKTEDVTITFNREMMINESEVIDNYLKSGGRGLSRQTLIRNHPWDDGNELQRVEDQEEDMLGYRSAFNALEVYADDEDNSQV